MRQIIISLLKYYFSTEKYTKREIFLIYFHAINRERDSFLNKNYYTGIHYIRTFQSSNDILVQKKKKEMRNNDVSVLLMLKILNWRFF